MGRTKFVFLIAAERSGTHLLRSILSTADITALGEICNVSAPSDFRYFEFRVDFLRKNPDLFLPSYNNQNQVLEAYLDWLAAKFPRHDTIVCDVKYAHVHNFNSFWWDFSVRPLLLEFARAHRLPVIHLIRKRAYQTAVSTMYAEKTGVWRTTKASELPTATVHIDLDWLQDRVYHLKRTAALFQEWLEFDCVLTVHYEDIVGADRAKTLERLTEFLAAPEPLTFRSPYLKTTPPYEQSIANFDQVKDLLELDVLGSNRSDISGAG